MGDPEIKINVQDKTTKFLSLFSNLIKTETKDSSKNTVACIEGRIFYFLHFYELHKRNINKKHAREIIFSELPKLCFENHIENATLLVEMIYSIDELQPTGSPYVVLFIAMLCLTNKTLPLNVVLKRNEMKKPSFTSLTYFLHYAFKRRLTIRNRKLTEMITFTNPLLFSKILLYSDSRSLLSLLQFGLRFEFPFELNSMRIHPIFLCAAELLSWFIEMEHFWNTEDPRRRTQQTHLIKKLSLFCRNFKVLMLSTLNPHKVKSEVVRLLLSHPNVIDFGQLKPYFDYLFPDMNFQTYKPPNLQHMCRYAIRTRLDEKWMLPYGVWKLHLPRTFASYLNFSVDEKGNKIWSFISSR